MRGNPMLAWNPSPAMNQVIDIRHGGWLRWSPGENVVEHDVYVGTDKSAVQTATTETVGIYKGRQAETAYDLGEPLAWDTTYFWRVDEVADDGTVVEGNIWSFTVADYLIVDDFESYTDDMDTGEAIFQTWLDGYGSSDNGSQASYFEAPFAEQRIVHAGRQSMPLHYSNGGTFLSSETRRTWASAQDWTVHDLARLVLYLRGNADNDPMRLYVTITDTAGHSATAVHGNADIVLTADWIEWSIPFSDLAPVDLTAVEAMLIGLGDRADPTSGIGMVYIDDIQVQTAR